jgi:ABC-2 type transport system permease protein/oleandomycin transport system permease protein
MSRWAALTGRTLCNLIRNVFVIALMLVVGLAVGFRFGDTTTPAAMAGFGLILLTSYTYSWVSAVIGLATANAEAVHAASFMWVTPLVFISSAYVRVDTLPGWLQPFAEHQPVTPVVNAARALFLGGPVAANLLEALAWSVGILAVFGPLGVRAYQRATAR